LQFLGSCRQEKRALSLKKIIAGAAISGVLGFPAVGLGAGVANPNPSALVVAGIPSSLHNPGWFDPGAPGYGSGLTASWVRFGMPIVSNARFQLDVCCDLQ
jgi:hypothetical protein